MKPLYNHIWKLSTQFYFTLAASFFMTQHISLVGKVFVSSALPHHATEFALQKFLK